MRSALARVALLAVVVVVLLGGCGERPDPVEAGPGASESTAPGGGASDQAPRTPGPGVARDGAAVEALFGRFGLGAPGTEVLARVEAGRSVLVAGQVGEECDPPTGARLVTADTGLELLPTGPRIPEGLLCEALSRAVVVLAVDPDLVPTGTRIGGQPADAPAG